MRNYSDVLEGKRRKSKSARFKSGRRGKNNALGEEVMSRRFGCHEIGIAQYKCTGARATWVEFCRQSDKLFAQI